MRSTLPALLGLGLLATPACTGLDPAPHAGAPEPTPAAIESAGGSPDPAGTLVVANKGEATVSLIDLASGEVVATLPTGEAPHEVAVSPDGATAVVTDYGNRERPGSTLTVIDVPGARVVRTVELAGYTRPHGVAWLDGRRVAVTAEAQKALLVVDVESGEILRAVDTAQEVSHMVALGAGRAWVANIGSGSVTVIDLEKGERVANVATGDGAEGVAVASGRAWITNRAAGTVTVLDAATLEKVAQLDCPGFPIRAVATADGAHVLVTRAATGDLVIFDAENVGEKREIELGVELKDTENRLFGDRFGDSSVPIGVVVTEGGHRAWIAHANADVISEHALPGGDRVRLLKAGREPDGMAHSPLRVGRDGD